MTASRVEHVVGRQIFDSRGRPTVEADVYLQDGTLGRASAPSGASTGRHEAHELRDGDPRRYGGRGVHKAVGHVSGEICTLLKGCDVLDQRGIDEAMRNGDGTENLERLGANAILATSLAAARAAAAHRRVPLYAYLAGLDARFTPSLPLPMTNILSGGAHAGRAMDFQDFLAVPVGAKSLTEAIDMLIAVRAAAADEMEAVGLSVLLADEGGLSPGYRSARESLDLMMRSFERAGLRPGEDMAIAVDVAATELFADGIYELAVEGRRLPGRDMLDYVADLCRRYPVVSVEDPLAEDDWENWRAFTATVEAQVIGDDLCVTNPERIAKAVANQSANAVLIKLNQNGTLTGTLDAMALVASAGYVSVVSARSGETEDPFMADLAVGTGAGQIKIGSLRNSERLAKYNQLLRIEEAGGIPFAGRAALAGTGNRASLRA